MPPQIGKGIVALIGRPNVGKSTLFNRMIGQRKAITDPTPGVTRDLLYGHCDYRFDNEDYPHLTHFTVVDSGGYETDDFKFQPFEDNKVWQNSIKAIEEADIVALVLDGSSGLIEHDRRILETIQKMEKPFICVVNKVDGIEKAWDAAGFYKLGVDQLYQISAAYNRGIDELRRVLSERLSKMAQLSTVKHHYGETPRMLSLLGRPNAGKSSILNRLLGKDVAIVSEIAGTTRDSKDVSFTYNNHPYVIIDTAGLRRKTKIEDVLEKKSVSAALRSIESADVILYVADAIEGLTDQDTRLINIAISRSKPVVLILNKWDLVPEKTSLTEKTYLENIRTRHLGDRNFIPIITVSCLTNQRVSRILKITEELFDQFEKRVNTATLNTKMQEILDGHPPRLISNFSKRPKFFYATQVSTKPPKIVVKCNFAKHIETSYKKYLLKNFKLKLGFEHIPVQIDFQDKNKAEQKAEAH